MLIVYLHYYILLLYGLERVTLSKNDAVMDLLEFYMGKNTMERQNFIVDNLVVEEDKPEEE